MVNQSISINIPFLKKNFCTKKVGPVLFISEDVSKEDIAIFISINGSIVMDMGIYEDQSFHGVEKLFPDLAGFKKDLEFFCSIAEAVVEGVYLNAKTNSPPIALNLKPMRIPKTVDLKNSPMIMSNDIFAGARDALVEKLIVVERASVSFDQIGGQKKAVEEIKELSCDIESRNLYDAWGTEPPKGVLLVGPPGNGKTLLAKALASSTKAKFFSVKMTDIVNSLWGEQEKILQVVFDKAVQGAPSIIFFDEIDAVAARRYVGGGLVQLVTVFLQNMDSFEDRPNVTLLASSNRPDAIDPAIKRAGRFDVIIDVQNPDEAGRIEIFEIHKRIAESRTKRKIFRDLEFSSLANRSAGMNGADIKEIIRRTLEAKVRIEKRIGSAPLPVSTEDILLTIENYERFKKVKAGLGFTGDINKKSEKYEN